MATGKRTTTKRIAPNPFMARLRALGCTYCAQCQAFMYPDHTEHITAFGIDQHVSRYVLVGGYGSVRAVRLEPEPEMAEAA